MDTLWSKDHVMNDMKKYVQDVGRSPEWDLDDLKSRTSIESDVTEASYDVLFTKEEFLIFFVSLCANQKWMFFVACNVLTTFLIHFYWWVFGFYEDQVFEFCLMVSDLTFTIDILSLLSNSILKVKVNIKKINKCLTTLDMLTIVPIFLGNFYVKNLTDDQRTQLIGFVLIRCYRLPYYFYLVGQTAGQNMMQVMTKKYLIIYLLLSHSLTGWWYYLKKAYEPNWATDYPVTVRIEPKKNYEWYFVAFYFINQTCGLIGFGDIGPVSELEQFAITIIYWSGFVFLQTLFVSDWTNVQTEMHRRHVSFFLKFRLIDNDLKQDKRISDKLLERVMDYYLLYWRCKSAITTTSLDLFQVLPKPLIQRVLVDQYWIALKGTFIFQDLDVAVLRDMALVMKTQLYQPGDLLFKHNFIKDHFVFIVKGTVQILAAMDDESPVVNLSAGTVLNELGMVITSCSAVHVRAASVCEIQFLAKVELWRTLTKYTYRHQSYFVHRRIAQKMKHAHALAEVNKMKLSNRPPLKLFKSKLKSSKLTESMVTVMLDPTKNMALIDKQALPFGARLITEGYVFSKVLREHSDDICLRTAWPWILRPKSQFLYIWESVICTIAFMEAISIPYFATLTLGIPPVFDLFYNVNYAIYLIDIEIQLSTAIEVEQGIVGTIREIIILRLKSFHFLLDVIAIIPTVPIVFVLYPDGSGQLEMLLKYNRLLKFYRIFRFLGVLQNNFRLNFIAVRLVMYVILFMFPVYWTGTLYYLIACYNRDCLPHSWVAEMKRIQNDSPVMLMLYSSISIVSGAGFGDNGAKLLHEFILLSVYFIIGTIVFSYLVSDYTAVLSLMYNFKSSYDELMGVMQQSLNANNTPPQLARRILSYLELQWKQFSGYTVLSNEPLLFEAQDPLIEQVQAARCLQHVQECELFQGLDKERLRQLTRQGGMRCIQPNEFIVIAGHISEYCYFIDEGYAEIISVITEKVERILGPGDYIAVFEMICQQPIVYNIRSSTVLKLYRFSYTIVMQMFMQDDQSYKDLTNFTTAAQKSLALKDHVKKACEISAAEVKEVKPRSWFNYNLRNRKVFLAYMEPFEGLDIFGLILRKILMKRTLIPDGKFLVYWEIQRATLAFITSMLFPSLVFIGANFPYAYYIAQFLDITAYIDIYVRLHVGYYNSKGILISHPLYTAINYFKNAMLIDVLGCLPFEKLVKELSTEHGSFREVHVAEHLFAMTRLLQVYRIPTTFDYFAADILKPINIAWIGLKYFVISCIFFNVFAVLSITAGALVVIDHNKLQILPIDQFWIDQIKDNYSFDVRDPFRLLILAWYWIVNATMGNALGDITPISGKMMFYMVLFIVWGFLWFTYMLVILSLGLTNNTITLSMYQGGMKKTLKYMKTDLVARNLRQRAWDHLEYTWQRDHGLYPADIIKKCNVTLQQDHDLFLYENTLKHVVLLHHISRTFLRQLSQRIDELYCLPDHNIFHCNDLLENIYIVHKGNVAIYGPDGGLRDILSRGSIFGNLDQIDIIRSMVTARSINHVDYLKINTIEFYELAALFASNVVKRLQYHFLLENMSYFKSGYKDKTQVVIEIEKDTKFLLFQPGSKMCLLYTSIIAVVSYFSIIQTTYHIAFQNMTRSSMMLLYFFDFLFILRYVSLFYIPFYRKGFLITDQHLIKRRYLTIKQIIWQNFSCIPFELISIFFEDQEYMYTWLCFNRCIRIIQIYSLVTIELDQLNVNIYFIKFCSCSIYVTLLIHMLSCVWWYLGCPHNECTLDGWNPEYSVCDKEAAYTCCFYFVSGALNGANLGDIKPRQVSELLYMVFNTYLAQYFLAYFLSETGAVVQNLSQTLVDYNYNVAVMKKYMVLNNISAGIQESIILYSRLLWQFEQGSQIPDMIDLLPYTLRENVLWSAYQKHFNDNYVFAACHPDFLRQLSYHLKRWTFFKGDRICQQGDVNNTMYFVQSGNVSVIDEAKSFGPDIVITDVLKERDCFGLVQGLFPLLPHDYTFRADSKVVLLSLELDTWCHMLDFFPASEAMIYQRMNDVKEMLAM